MKIRYLVTIQLGGALVASPCFDARRAVVPLSGVYLMLLDENGVYLIGGRGMTDAEGDIYVEENSESP